MSVPRCGLARQANCLLDVYLTIALLSACPAGRRAADPTVCPFQLPISKLDAAPVSKQRAYNYG